MIYQEESRPRKFRMYRIIHGFYTGDSDSVRGWQEQ
ncbi:hypothetical protein CK5_10020 [Blautia obeum A2-162]|uniref:Uncharacterized protein n=1 Tax=Blautia obeum A2-162 TaxID=657314 RepID=D4LXZ6_9FIRM|nr:hypothetical protein CK5_10020 [Blautia obeum A2-162]